MEKGKQAAAGAVALSAVGVLGKVIGILYRVPLANLIGPEGMGLFQMVFPLYTLLMTVSSAGLPVAISVLVASLLARDRVRDARWLVRAALRVLGLAGLLGALLLFACSGPLARQMGSGLSAPGFQYIAPSVLCICLISVYRGYLMGAGAMLPTARNQLLEQLLRVAVSLPFAMLGMRQGPAQAAAFALLGTSLAEGLTLLHSWVLHRRYTAKEGPEAPGAAQEPEDRRLLARKLLAWAVPVTAAAALVPAVNLLDAFTNVGLLVQGGLPREGAVLVYGLYSGSVLTLLNVLSAVALALASAVAPRISAAMARGAGGDVRRMAGISLRWTALVAFPAVVGLMMLARPLMVLFYPSFSPEELDIAGELLRVAAPGVLLFMWAQVSGAVLQGAGRPWLPFAGLLAAVAVKLISVTSMVPQSRWGILGAPVSSTLAYGVVLLLHLYWMRRATGFRLRQFWALWRPALCALGMGLALGLVREIWPGSGGLYTLALVLLGILAYALLLLRIGGVTASDFDMMPGGGRLKQWLQKARLLRKDT